MRKRALSQALRPSPTNPPPRFARTALALAVLASFGAPEAMATTINVTAGAIDNTVNGNCSIVEAINGANADTLVDQCAQGSGTDTIVLPASSSFDFTVAQGGAAALPAIASTLIIEANGSTIRRTGGGQFRILTVNSGANLTLRDATVSGGSAASNSGGMYVSSGGTATLDRCTVTGNTVGGTATYSAGGIKSRGTLNLFNSTVSGNTASVTGGSYGGIYFQGGTGNLLNSTIASNAATAGAYRGGVGRGAASVSYTNVIIAGNSGNSQCGSFGGSQTGSNNRDTDGSCGTGFTSGSPNLQALANNGGLTQTHALGAGSDAINAGHNTTCQGASINNLDQRGFVRPTGSCDIGSFEFGASAPVLRDFGDAPGTFDTSLADDGPRHTISSLLLGSAVDAESDGAPGAAATGDDTAGNDDEDGVTFGTLEPGTTGSATIVASAAGKVDLWVDFNDNGDFYDAADQVLNGVSVATGSNVLSVPVPSDAALGGTYARVRLSTAGGLGPNGAASDGEVEDYAVTLVDATGPTVTIDQAGAQADPVSSGSIQFTVVFDESTTQFDETDVQLSGSALPTTAVVSGSGAIYGVTVSGMTRSGTVIATIPAGAIKDAALNDSSASTSTDNTVTIRALASLSLSATSFGEDGGTATLTATLDRPAGASTDVAITFLGSAARDTDYSAITAPINIATGDTVGTLTLTGLDDAVFDAETVRMVIPETAAVGRGATWDVSATITDDEPPLTATLAAGAASIAENGSTTLTVNLNSAVTVDTSFALAYDNVAVRGSDFNAATSITVPNGSNSASITLSALDDLAVEPTERLRARLQSNTAAVLGTPSSVNIDITDNDGVLPNASLSVNPSNLAEGGTAGLTATLDAPAIANTTVKLQYAGSATSADFTGASQIVIPSGQTNASITLSGTDDVVYEAAEVLKVKILSATNATFSATQLSIPMTDNDTAPVVMLAFGVPTMPETGGSAQLTATLDAPAAANTTIAITWSGSATGADFVQASSIVIPSGQQTASVAIATKHDVLDEANEVIKASVGAASQAVAATAVPVSVTILDDD